MPDSTESSSQLKGWLRGCAAAAALLGFYVLLSGTFSWWRLLLGLLLLSCPVLIGWLGWRYARPSATLYHPGDLDSKEAPPRHG